MVIGGRLGSSGNNVDDTVVMTPAPINGIGSVTVIGGGKVYKPIQFDDNVNQINMDALSGINTVHTIASTTNTFAVLNALGGVVTVVANGTSLDDRVEVTPKLLYSSVGSVDVTAGGIVQKRLYIDPNVNEVVVNAGAGNDTVLFYSGIWGTVNVGTVNGGDGNDTIWITANKPWAVTRQRQRHCASR